MSIIATGAKILTNLKEVTKMMSKEATRPDVCDDEMLVYLDDLRESGATNMYGATPYLQSDFPDLSKAEARAVLSYWMKTLGNENR